MEKQIQLLHNTLGKEKDFFNSYRDRFTENFVSVFSEISPVKIPEEKIKKLSQDLYIKLFSLKGDPLNELYSLSKKMYETGVDIRGVLSKTFMIMIKDLLEVLINKNEDIHILKNFISLIDLYLFYVDKASADYIKSIEAKLSQSEEEKRKIQLNAILDLFVSNKDNLVIVDHFYEVPVTCRGRLIRVEEDSVIFDVGECINKVFEENHFVFVKIPDVNKTVKARIKSVDYNRGILVLQDFSYSSIPQERRRFVRVRLSEKIPVIIHHKNRYIDGIIDDISVGGLGIFIANKDDLQVDDKVLLSFLINGYTVETVGQIKYISKIDKAFRIGVQFLDLSPKDEELIGEFVTKRQFEILRKLRQL